jgi:hypothetical protein
MREEWVLYSQLYPLLYLRGCPTRTRTGDVLQHLSLNCYSIFSLIHDILTRSDKRFNLENESINLLREGLERDAALAFSATAPYLLLYLGGLSISCKRGCGRTRKRLGRPDAGGTRTQRMKSAIHALCGTISVIILVCPLEILNVRVQLPM